MSFLWSFTHSCHSWHLTNRWRKSEKVTALFLQFFLYLHLLSPLRYSHNFFFFVLDFSFSLHCLLPCYIFITVTAHWGLLEWVEVSHHISESAQSVPYVWDKLVSNSIPLTGCPKGYTHCHSNYSTITVKLV